ncbi:MAG TPA: gamma carbonic anhydrase family protein [Bacillota bacterium]|nr:gamma carbonic anhydrase family protein [Bacillota bacterium]
MLIEFKGFKPKVAKDCFIAPGAQLVGRVEIASRASVWFNAVIRGDEEKVFVGEGTNVQDGCILHQDVGYPLLIGKGVTLGHNAILHGCIIGDNVLVGMGATILNGAKIGDGSIVGAGALVTQGKEIPPNSLVVGAPAKVIRQLTEEESASIRESEKIYCELAETYLEALGQGE